MKIFIKEINTIMESSNYIPKVNTIMESSDYIP